MMRRHPKLPFYRQLCEYVAKGMYLLDSSSISGLKQFVLSKQGKNGGFVDRAGKSDLYYSLFAHFILKGSQETSYVEKLLQFVETRSAQKELGLVDRCCVLILMSDLKGKNLRKLKTIIRIVQHLFRENYDGFSSYRYFLIFLTLDACGLNNLLTRSLARLVFKQTKLQNKLPCTSLAAQIIFRRQIGYDVSKELAILTDYFEEHKGFKVSLTAVHADLLSTAVALTALKTSQVEVAAFAPDCLRFVEMNYDEGAFLSGDGDRHRDTEYTFYGLLALGTLA